MASLENPGLGRSALAVVIAAAVCAGPSVGVAQAGSDKSTAKAGSGKTSDGVFSATGRKIG